MGEGQTTPRKQMNVDKWVSKERKEILKVQKHLMQGCTKLASLIEHVMKEKSLTDRSLLDRSASNTKSFIIGTHMVQRQHIGLIPVSTNKSFQDFKNLKALQNSVDSLNDEFVDNVQSVSQNSIRITIIDDKASKPNNSPVYH